jgi:hypothetical protein
VTLTLIAEPAVADAGALTENCTAGPAVTVTFSEVPVMSRAAVSLAVTVCSPAVFRVSWNVPVPLVRPESGDRLAAASELVKFTVPA